MKIAVGATADVVSSPVNPAAVVNRGFDFDTGTTQVGMLNREHVGMRVTGIQQDVTIGVIPLAPVSQAVVTTKESCVMTQHGLEWAL